MMDDSLSQKLIHPIRSLPWLLFYFITVLFLRIAYNHKKEGVIKMIDGHMHLEYGDLNKEYVLKFVDAAVKKV